MTDKPKTFLRKKTFTKSFINCEQDHNFLLSQAKQFTISQPHLFRKPHVHNFNHRPKRRNGKNDGRTWPCGRCVQGGNAFGAVIDLDPQASATNWKDRRAEGSPCCRVGPIEPPETDIAAAEDMGAEVIDHPHRRTPRYHMP